MLEKVANWNTAGVYIIWICFKTALFNSQRAATVFYSVADPDIRFQLLQGVTQKVLYNQLLVLEVMSTNEYK